MNKIQHLPIVVLLFLLLSCSKSNDFDSLCLFYNTLENESNLVNMSAKDKFEYINALVNTKLAENSDARASWYAIINLTPEMRYQLFTEAAESSLNKSWRCDSLKNHIVDIPESN